MARRSVDKNEFTDVLKASQIKEMINNERKLSPFTIKNASTHMNSLMVPREGSSTPVRSSNDD